MKYKVDNIISFDADLNILTHIETQECISLTMSQSMLLELILKSQSEVLTRDTIIDILWRRHGINTTGNTLNQYISLLRKLFTHFGVTELIVTIPRVGVRLNPNVLISHTRTIESDYLVNIKEISHEKRSSHKKNIGNKIIFFTIIILILVSIIYILLEVRINSDNTVFTFYTENGCQIGLKAHITSEDRKLILPQIKEILTENKLFCRKGRVAYFDFSKSIFGNDYGRAMLAFCTEGDNQKIISCENYYYRNWRVE